VKTVDQYAERRIRQVRHFDAQRFYETALGLRFRAVMGDGTQELGFGRVALASSRGRS